MASRKKAHTKIFFNKVLALINKEDVQNIWNESANIGYMTIKSAVYWMLTEGVASTDDIREALDKALKDYNQDHPL